MYKTKVQYASCQIIGIDSVTYLIHIDCTLTYYCGNMNQTTTITFDQKGIHSSREVETSQSRSNESFNPSSNSTSANFDILEKAWERAHISISTQWQKSSTEEDPFYKFLGLIDLRLFSSMNFSINMLPFSLGNNARPGQSMILGSGKSFVVRRIVYDRFTHSIFGQRDWDSKPRFVVLKQALASSNSRGDDADRFQQALLELKILSHNPMKRHPNIVRLLQVVWDTQNGPNYIAPTLVVEYADLGPLSAFQDPQKVALHAQTKIQICIDIARGLEHLHSCGIVHGDVKAE